MKKRIVRWIVFCLAFFIMALCMGKRKETDRYYQGKENCQVIDGVADTTYRDMETMKENQDFIAGCYSADPAQSIAGEEQRSAEVTVIAVDGDSDLLFHSGNVLYRGDDAGCLLDKDTMYEIFGTSVSVGGTVTYAGTEYVVRGIVDDTIPLMVINLHEPETLQGAESDREITGIILDTEGELYRGQYQEKLLSAYGIAGNAWYMTDYRSPANWIETPSKWSDFGFWGDYADHIRDRLEHMVFENKEVPEQLCLKNGLKGAGYLLISVAALIYMIVRVIKALGNAGFRFARAEKTIQNTQEQEQEQRQEQGKQIKEEDVCEKS